MRYLLVAITVGVFVAIGYLFHLGLAYLIVGIPITILFQIVVARRPLRELWLRNGQPMILDRHTLLLAAVFLIGPIQMIIKGLNSSNWAVIIYGIAACGGSAGAAFAYRVLNRADLRRLGLLFILSIPLALTRLLIEFMMGTHDLSDTMIEKVLWVGLQSLLLYVPAVFVVEEVFFRGALDSYLHRHERGRGWYSAVFVSLLWGLWHAPLIHPLTLNIVLFELLAPQLVLGLIFSWLWRRSGNLAMSGTVHALFDAVRDALLTTA